MRILVTGGLGFIGSALIPTLAADGHEVHSCDIRHTAHEHGFSIPVQGDYYRCDVANFRQLERVVNTARPDLIYHCAAEFGRWNGEDFYEQLWRTNVIGTKNVIRLQERLGFRLVFFSSSEVYGDWAWEMREEVPIENPIHLLNDYAMTKWIGEMQVRNSARRTGTETVIVRLFNTFGIGEFYSPYRSVNCCFLYKALHGLPWTIFSGHSRTSTYIDDAVHTLVRIAEIFKSGEVYNIAGFFLHSIKHLSDIVLRVTNADPALVSRSDSEPMTTMVKRVNPLKAEKDLGLECTVPLEDGMARTAEWMRKVYSESIARSRGAA